MTSSLVFMGTPDFAVSALRPLHQAGHNIIAVYTQPPRPARRGQKLQKTPVHLEAETCGLEVRTPSSLKSTEEQDKLRALKPDVIIVAAYGLILPKEVLEIPPKGCLNIHASLLPRWRGAAPIHRALLAGDTKTGITIMQMDEGLDTGDMLLKQEIPITNQDTTNTLHDKLATCGGQLILEALTQLEKNELTPQKQNDSGACYADKLTREEGAIDWRKPAQDLERQIRALTPWPGSFFDLDGARLKILEAALIETSNAPIGTLLDQDFTIACGRSALRLVRVQKQGRPPTDGASFLRGARIKTGTSLL